MKNKSTLLKIFMAICFLLLTANYAACQIKYAGYPTNDEGVPNDPLGSWRAYGSAEDRTYVRVWIATESGTAQAINCYAASIGWDTAWLVLYNRETLLGIAPGPDSTEAWTGYHELTAEPGQSLSFETGDSIFIGIAWDNDTGNEGKFYRDNADLDTVKIKISRTPVEDHPNSGDMEWEAAAVKGFSFVLQYTTGTIPIGGGNAELLAYYSFDELVGDTVKDGSGNGNDGLLLNGATVLSGKVGNGLSLDGVDDIMEVLNSTAEGHPMDFVDGDEFSLVSWVKKQSEEGSIIAKRDGGTCQYQFFSGPGGIPSLRHGGTVKELGDALPNDTWVHMAVTFDLDMNLQYYQDGAAVGDPIGPAHITHKENVPVSIGARWNTYPATGYNLTGMIDEVYIYSGVLTAGQVDSLYQNEPSAIPGHIMLISDIKLYPVPSNGSITIECGGTHFFGYKIINITGTTVREGQFKGPKADLDVSILKSGLYLLQLDNLDTGGTQVLKWVIK